ncbi:uncharacterized protein [Chelonus insularis]|uniref:uncharacterized protein isoform X2 n=1 Tax=Chelonus insularis TaxID=460826 RepID=UPI00158E3145|nr:uncharacterized protein LOC118070942 isoform X2 [Chelonus insularis]
MSTTKCPIGLSDPCDSSIINDTKNQQLSTSERLNQLEKEVNTLRSDFDKMKWEQAVVETVIGRAIIRGSASLSGCYELLCPKTTNIQGTKNLMLEDGQKDPFCNSKLNLLQKNLSPDKKTPPSPSPPGQSEIIKKNYDVLLYVE